MPTDQLQLQFRALMPAAKQGKVRQLLIVVLLAVVMSACARPQPEAQGQHYELKGTIVSFDKGQRQVVITHEDIPGLMEGMTMGFTLKEDAAFDVLRPGDKIQATLVVAGDRSWLQDPIITQATPAAGQTLTPDAAAEPQLGTQVPDVKLTNQDGKPISLQQFRGRALLLTFIYTRCPLPDYCTRMSTNFAALNRALQGEAELRPVRAFAERHARSRLRHAEGVTQLRRSAHRELRAGEVRAVGIGHGPAR